jgi:hypothetical protein
LNECNRLLRKVETEKSRQSKIDDIVPYRDAVEAFDEKVNRVANLLDDIERTLKAPLLKFEYKELSSESLNDKLATTYWKKLPKDPSDGLKVYSTLVFCSGINGIDRAYRSIEDVRDLYFALSNGTLSPEQEKILEQYTRTDKRTGKTVTGKKMLKHLVEIQKAAMKIEEPLLLRRRMASLTRFRKWKIGEVHEWSGITSTYGTLDAFENPKFVKEFGNCVIEVRVPIGSYVIPIGNYGTTWHSLDEIALPARTSVKILEFQITDDPPKMVVEVIPAPPVQF